MMKFIEASRPFRGPLELLLRGALFSICWGALLFCIVPNLAVRLLPMAGIPIR